MGNRKKARERPTLSIHPVPVFQNNSTVTLTLQIKCLSLFKPGSQISRWTASCIFMSMCADGSVPRYHYCPRC